MIIEDAATIEAERLNDYLERVVPHFQEVRSLAPFAAGRSNPTFLLEAASGRYVLRTRPRGAVLSTAHQIDREFRVLQALQYTDVPVPKVLHLCSDDTVIGRPFYLMTFLEGRIEEDAALPRESPSQRSIMFEAAVDALARLHSVDWAWLGLADYGRPAGYMPRQVKRWTTQFRSAQTQDYPNLERLIRWLEMNCPEGARGTIVHGDYRFGNLMFAPDAPHLRAVLDWELSTLGDPFCDLGYFCQVYYTSRRDEPLGGIRDVDRSALGIPEISVLLDRYCASSRQPLPVDWNAYLAFSFFRMAAITHGVYARQAQRNGQSTLSNIEALNIENTAGLGLKIALTAHNHS